MANVPGNNMVNIRKKRYGYFTLILDKKGVRYTVSIVDPGAQMLFYQGPKEETARDVYDKLATAFDWLDIINPMSIP